MPQDRLRNQCAGTSRKLSSLTDFEYRVWDQYQLSADDYGIMPAEAIRIQADNLALRARPAADVQNALDRMVEIGLLFAFDVQHRRYVCDPQWQYFQRVQYPKQTLNPAPPAAVLDKCHLLTQALFAQCFGRRSHKFRKPPELSEPVLENSEISQNLPEGPRSPQVASTKWLVANGKEEMAKSERPPDISRPFQRRAPEGRSDGVMAGALGKEHNSHRACSPNFAWCVPGGVHAKFRNALAPRFGRDDTAADVALEAWYAAVWSDLPTDFIMPDAFKFWQRQFDAKWATPPAPTERDQPAYLKPMSDEARQYISDKMGLTKGGIPH